MYAVLGITGNTGAAAAAALLDAGQEVLVLVRNPDKAVSWRRRGVELADGRRRGRRELAGAVHGRRWRLCAGAAAARAPRPDRLVRPKRRRPSATLATASGLPRLVFLSSEGAHLPSGTGPNSRGVHEGERILRDLLGHPRHLSPSDLLPGQLGVGSRARGRKGHPADLPRPTWTSGAPWSSTRDIGATAASPASRPRSPPRSWSWKDPSPTRLGMPPRVVAQLGPVARSRRWSCLAEPWVETLTGAGLGRPYAELLAEMYDGINAVSRPVPASFAAARRRSARRSPP